MMAIERFFRDLLTIERLEQLHGEISALGGSLYRIDEAQELLSITRAERFVQLAVRALKAAQAEARAHCQPEMLEAQLSASLELVGRSPERMRREQKA